MNTRITVTVDAAYLTGIEEVAGALRAAGMRVESVLASIGVITGSAEPNQLHVLTIINGVASVDEQFDYRLPPPDSDIQ